MKPAGSLARAGFHSHFTWEFIQRVSSGRKARHLDVSYNFCLLWIKISNEQCTGAKMSGPLCCVYMDDFQPALLGEILGI